MNLDAYTTEQLQTYNKAIVAELRRRHTQKQVTAGRAFTPGELAKFTNSRNGKVVTIRIERINTKSMSGKCIDTGTPWRVSPSLCSLA